MSLVRIPKYCFAAEISKVKRVNIDEALMELTSREDDGMRLILEMNEFESSLTDQERIAFRMKRHGYVDQEWKDFAAEMWAEGHSFFVYRSDSVDS